MRALRVGPGRGRQERLKGAAVERADAPWGLAEVEAKRLGLGHEGVAMAFLRREAMAHEIAAKERGDGME